MKIRRDLSGIVEPVKTKKPNSISTTLYSIWTFLPMGLFNQIKKPTNIYFILIACLNLIPVISTGRYLAYFLPVAIVIVFNAAFDWSEDFRRFLRDRAINKKYVKVFRNGVFLKIRLEDIQIGEIIKLVEDEEVPADIVLLAKKESAEECFVQTSTLDGEKALKPKNCLLSCFENALEFCRNLESFELEFRKNVPNLDQFEAIFSRSSSSLEQTPVLLSHFIPKSAKIKSTPEIIAVAVYVGKQTKIMLNTQARILKNSQLDTKLGLYIIIVFGAIGCILTIICISALVHHENIDFELKFFESAQSRGLRSVTTLLGYFIIINAILPISLIISIKMIKLFQKYIFIMDPAYKSIEGECGANSIEVHEELGQIDLVLSDKTGTLTQNKMIVKNFQIGRTTRVFPENLTLIKESELSNLMIESMDHKSSTNLTQEKLNELFILAINSCHTCHSESKPDVPNSEEYEKDKIQILENSQVQLLADNKVSPIKSPCNESQKSHTNFFGQSSDEIALLNASREYESMLFIGRTVDAKFVVIESEKNIKEEIRVYLINEFDCDRKMMSVIVEWKNEIWLLVKGADSAILSKSSSAVGPMEKLHNLVLEAVNEPLKKGYRILFFAARMLSRSELEIILQENLDTFRDPSLKKDFVNNLESNLTLFGFSAIEDQLQENLSQCISMFRSGGVKIWVATGDKSDTARNIAFASGLFDSNSPVYDLKCLEESTIFENAKKKNFLISGAEFARDLSDKKCRKKVLSRLLEFECVVFSRMTPNQKVEIVRLLKETKIRVLAIGDGANDVNMIQEANVGVGIAGEEGVNAANAADFTIPCFKFLPIIMFGHGRICYFRNSFAILFSFYKSFLVTIPQVAFAFKTGFSRSQAFPDWYSALFNLLFSSLPIFSKSISDYDIPMFNNKNSSIHVKTYSEGPKNQLFNSKKFIFWVLSGIFESLIIFFIPFINFKNKLIKFSYPVTYEFLSMIWFSSIVIFPTIKLIIFTRSFSLITVMGYSSGLIFFIIFAYSTNELRIGGFKSTQDFREALKSGMFWISLISIIMVLTLISFTFVAIRDWCFPDVKAKINQKYREVSDDCSDYSFKLPHKEHKYPLPVRFLFY